MIFFHLCFFAHFFRSWLEKKFVQVRIVWLKLLKWFYFQKCWIIKSWNEMVRSEKVEIRKRKGEVWKDWIRRKKNTFSTFYLLKKSKSFHSPLLNRGISSRNQYFRTFLYFWTKRRTWNVLLSSTFRDSIWS